MHVTCRHLPAMHGPTAAARGVCWRTRCWLTAAQPSSLSCPCCHPLPPWHNRKPPSTSCNQTTCSDASGGGAQHRVFHHCFSGRPHQVLEEAAAGGGVCQALQGACTAGRVAAEQHAAAAGRTTAAQLSSSGGHAGTGVSHRCPFLPSCLQAHLGPVVGLAVSRDGALCASISTDQTAKVSWGAGEGAHGLMPRTQL